MNLLLCVSSCRLFIIDIKFSLCVLVGMEFNKKYDLWKENLATLIVSPPSLKATEDKEIKKIARFRGTLMQHIDRLWCDVCLETILTGDVYNPGACGSVPRLYLFNEVKETLLGKVIVGESFRLADNPKEKYEVVINRRSVIFARII